MTVNTLYDISGIWGISLTASFIYSWPSSTPFGSSKPIARICSMILSSSGFDQRWRFRGGCPSPVGFKNSEFHLSRKNDRAGYPPHVSTLHAIAASKSPDSTRGKKTLGYAQVFASI